MKYSLVDTEKYFFVADDSGAPVFFPWGKTRQGYVVESAETRAKIVRNIKRIGTICIPAALLGSHLANHVIPVGQPWTTMLIVGLGGYFYYWAMIMYFVQDLPRSALRLTAFASFLHRASLFKVWHLVFLSIMLPIICANPAVRIVRGEAVPIEYVFLCLMVPGMIFFPLALLVRRQG